MYFQDGHILAAPKPHVKNQILPNPDLEEDRYFDTGCELAPSCLSCPFPVCKEDDPTIPKRLKQATFDSRVYAAWVANEYLTRKADRVMATAQDAGVVIRTVYRVLERRVS